jgi:hypothetical protein
VSTLQQYNYTLFSPKNTFNPNTLFSPKMADETEVDAMEDTQDTMVLDPDLASSQYTSDQEAERAAYDDNFWNMENYDPQSDIDYFENIKEEERRGKTELLPLMVTWTSLSLTQQKREWEKYSKERGMRLFLESPTVRLGPPTPPLLFIRSEERAPDDGPSLPPLRCFWPTQEGEEKGKEEEEEKEEEEKEEEEKEEEEEEEK